ncbi:hypothetical protein WwSim0151 [Wolbachia endosymbiont of Drosophila simulans]|nr:hypothetical protein WwSim0151 [Wolbachia endosymbiont of Drosophila simulans]
MPLIIIKFAPDWADFSACAVASKRASFSNTFLALFKSINFSAIECASSSSSVESNLAPSDASPILPPAFMHGPILNPNRETLGFSRIPKASNKTRKPTFFLVDITFNPCETSALLRPVICITSQTVPRATKSNRSNKSGSFLLVKNPCSRRLLLRATISRNDTPTAARLL